MKWTNFREDKTIYIINWCKWYTYYKKNNMLVKLAQNIPNIYLILLKILAAGLSLSYQKKYFLCSIFVFCFHCMWSKISKWSWKGKFEMTFISWSALIKGAWSNCFWFFSQSFWDFRIRRKLLFFFFSLHPVNLIAEKSSVLFGKY